MPGKINSPTNILGLSANDVLQRRQQYGKNIFYRERQRRFFHIVIDIVKEPMFFLLYAACSLYFILGESDEGIMMLVAMAFVAAISIYQEAKSTNAVKALRQFSQPKVMVIRDGREITVDGEELVPGDIIVLEEGMNIPADAIVQQENDFSVNESVITGESLPADKTADEGNNKLYQGTAVNSGKCIALVTATGNNTELGKLGRATGVYQPPKTILQVQLNKFVRQFALFGFAGFLIIFTINYIHYREWVTSLLFALTLAMSVIPEEIPVAFSSFMALGAYKMSRLGIISRQPQIVENLGAVNVICLDKTGTITENKMQLKTIYDHKNDTVTELQDGASLINEDVLRLARLASEANPFDAMEKAIDEAYNLYVNDKSLSQLNLVHEYPLDGRPPMMTHVYEYGNTKIAAAKGAAEKIIEVCRLADDEKKKINAYIKPLASKGYRVIGVAGAVCNGSEFPESQDNFNWRFEGLLGLYDPPKKNIPEVLKQFYGAGVQVKIITGDHPETAMNIAAQAGVHDPLKCVTGEMVMNMQADELAATAERVNVFARMFPGAKLKVIDTLKANGNIVAMTGDGVNDGPALKSADIGIAMGKRGTDIAREAADLIITDDNLQHMVTAITEGRKIFSNLVKAIRYIISIHIPIIMVASVPLLLGWSYPNIFTPVHIIFLELIMGPTCSIFFEKEPVEGKAMLEKPRNRNTGLFTKDELLISIVQGITIAAGALILYWYFINNGATPEQTRTIVFTTLITGNVFLTFTNRSFTKTIYYTSRYKNSLAPFILIISACFLLLLHFVPAVQELFRLQPVTPFQFLLSMGVACISVISFEVYKMDLGGVKRNA